MARLAFGGGTADYLETASGRRVAGSVTMWTAATGGTQVTDLLVGGVAVSAVTSDASGYLPELSGPDGVSKMYADGGGGRRVVLEAHEDSLSGGATADASTTVKGLVQLAGDLAGTAAAPTVPSAAKKIAVPGYQTWNGIAWSTRPTGFRYVEAFSDGTAGSAKDIAATTPTGAVDGDRWWKATA